MVPLKFEGPCAVHLSHGLRAALDECIACLNWPSEHGGVHRGAAIAIHFPTNLAIIWYSSNCNHVRLKHRV